MVSVGKVSSSIERIHCQAQREVGLHLHFLTVICVLNVILAKTKIFTVIGLEFFLNW